MCRNRNIKWNESRGCKFFLDLPKMSTFPLVPKLRLGNALPGKLQLPSRYNGISVDFEFQNTLLGA
jgi:hypothetical protein